MTKTIIKKIKFDTLNKVIEVEKNVLTYNLPDKQMKKQVNDFMNGLYNEIMKAPREADYYFNDYNLKITTYNLI